MATNTNKLASIKFILSSKCTSKSLFSEELKQTAQKILQNLDFVGRVISVNNDNSCVPKQLQTVIDELFFLIRDHCKDLTTHTEALQALSEKLALEIKIWKVLLKCPAYSHSPLTLLPKGMQAICEADVETEEEEEEEEESHRQESQSKKQSAVVKLEQDKKEEKEVIIDVQDMITSLKLQVRKQMIVLEENEQYKSTARKENRTAQKDLQNLLSVGKQSKISQLVTTKCDELEHAMKSLDFNQVVTILEELHEKIEDHPENFENEDDYHWCVKQLDNLSASLLRFVEAREKWADVMKGIKEELNVMNGQVERIVMQEKKDASNCKWIRSDFERVFKDYFEQAQKYTA